MAFLKANFAPAGANSTRGRTPGLFTYKTADSAATVDTSGYFNEVSQMLEVGDIIYRVTPLSGTPTAVGQHVVMSNASGVVDVSDTTALTLTDTD